MSADLLTDQELAAELSIARDAADDQERVEAVDMIEGYIAALRADRDAARALAADRREALDRQTENAAIFLADRDTLLDAIAKYGRHLNAQCRWAHPPVIWQGGMSAKPPCTCGFDDALARVRSHTGKDPA